MQHSEQINEISEALAKAQGQMKNPGLDGTGHFKNKFASLAAVRNAVVPSLSSNDIAMSQELCTVEGGGIACFTHLLHKSGQWMTFGPFVVIPEKPGAWGAGSAGTYAKRYGMMAVANVVGDEDDDGTAAMGAESATETISHALRGEIDKKQVPTRKLNATKEALREAMDRGDSAYILQIRNEWSNEEWAYIMGEHSVPARNSIRDHLTAAREAA